MASARLARLALALYPLAYRRRYGEEMAALVEDSGSTPAVAFVAVAMVGIALASAVYLVALLIDAPSLAAAGNGPGGLLSVGASVAITVGTMALAAAAGSTSARRAKLI